MFVITRPIAITSLLASFAAAVPAFAADPIRPDYNLTPGAVLTTDTRLICQPGYTKTVRHTSSHLKHEVYVEYGLDRRSGRYEIDHLIPLELGGADVRENLWPESFDTEPWNARVKDQLENFFHAEVLRRPHADRAGAARDRGRLDRGLPALSRRADANGASPPPPARIVKKACRRAACRVVWLRPRRRSSLLP